MRGGNTFYEQVGLRVVNSADLIVSSGSAFSYLEM
jgi:hypothetical protein